MARRPEVRQDDVLTREELKQLQQRLSHLSVASVEEFYRSAHHRCSFQPRHLPSPRALQELVQAWKLLRKWRGLIERTDILHTFLGISLLAQTLKQFRPICS